MKYSYYACELCKEKIKDDEGYCINKNISYRI